MKIEKKQLDIKLQFESISLPPVEDIMIVGKNSTFGKAGMTKCLYLLSPDSFEVLDYESELVEAIFVNKKILAKMPAEEIITVLEKNVFPFINKNEIIKIDFRVKVSLELTKTTTTKNEY